MTGRDTPMHALSLRVQLAAPVMSGASSPACSHQVWLQACAYQGKPLKGIIKLDDAQAVSLRWVAVNKARQPIRTDGTSVSMMPGFDMLLIAEADKHTTAHNHLGLAAHSLGLAACTSPKMQAARSIHPCVQGLVGSGHHTQLSCYGWAQSWR